MLQFIKRVLSYVVIIPVRQFISEYSGKMDIRWEAGRLVLNSPEANYSFNKLHKVLRIAFESLDLAYLKDYPILNLGMGAGSSIHILRNELGLENHIDSVEIDPTIVEAAKEYFNIDDYSDHSIHLRDALEFTRNEKKFYGLIIVDLFIDKEVSPRFLEREFFDLLMDRLSENGQIMFNYIGEEHPIKDLIGDESTLREVQADTNRVLIYRRTEGS